MDIILYIAVFINILLFFVYCFHMITLKANRIRLEQNKTHTRESFKEFLQQTVGGEKNLSIEVGKRFCYVPFKKIIMYIDKNEYDLTDVFAVFHEYGHFKDDVKDENFSDDFRLWGANRLFAIPAYFFSSLILFSFPGSVVTDINNLIFFIVMVLALHRIFTLIRYETSASRYAVDSMTNCLTPEEKNLIEKVAYSAKWAQVLQAMGGMVFFIVMKVFLILQ